MIASSDGLAYRIALLRRHMEWTQLSVRLWVGAAPFPGGSPDRIPLHESGVGSVACECHIHSRD